mmetsp:Transcript_39850/g.93731  ORF Transcript_39850/g.93731 Transcript_39850/m.93731 type:complete len:96 (+) Transcript_39850:453-740(+)
MAQLVPHESIFASTFSPHQAVHWDPNGRFSTLEDLSSLSQTRTCESLSRRATALRPPPAADPNDLTLRPAAVPNDLIPRPAADPNSKVQASPTSP